jgi:hypothetical protein
METLGLSRRSVTTGLLVGFAVTGAGCASVGGMGADLVEAVRRLLGLSARNGLAKLGAGGLVDAVAKGAGIGDALGGMLGGGTAGRVVQVLNQVGLMKGVERKIAQSAGGLVDKAVPFILDQVGTLSVADAKSIINGSGDAATVLLRAAIGNRLKSLLLPEVNSALAASGLAGDMAGVLALAGVAPDRFNLAGLADRVGTTVDNSLFGAIAAEERLIRANPQATGDPLLIKVFSQRS